MITHESQSGIVQHITTVPPITEAIAEAMGRLLSNCSLTSSLYKIRRMRDPQQMILRAMHEYAMMSIMKYALSDTTPVSIDGTNPQYTATKILNGVEYTIIYTMNVQQLLDDILQAQSILTM